MLRSRVLAQRMSGGWGSALRYQATLGRAFLVDTRRYTKGKLGAVLAIGAATTVAVNIALCKQSEATVADPATGLSFPTTQVGTVGCV